ncbi:hypothetical protein M4951_08275 [Blastopirellula sp. J2-11]|uniref:hypothetical protein n=1 Tax=Blastopirellula sp. J2-11 TaxID=2943192 RepID=UPI0021C982EF|nr:hypothetical protein [Blastopirellula sp. J2-11]UUO08299.1 hypothetical protein M4951_08275 [Blastopirellula sp. J2-11]
MANFPHHYWRIVLLLVLTGCGRGYNGPERASISGRISLDGQAIETGTIEFLPTAETAGPTAGAKISGGLYEIAEKQGPVLGRYQVRIHAHGKTGRKISPGSLEAAGTMIDEIGEIIPSKFNEKTTLERDVVAGKNQIDFELNSN